MALQVDYAKPDGTTATINSNYGKSKCANPVFDSGLKWDNPMANTTGNYLGCRSPCSYFTSDTTSNSDVEKLKAVGG